MDTLASRAAAFYSSLSASFDIAFAEFSDRDSGFYQHVYGDSGRSWWDAEDFRRSVRFRGGFSTAAAKRIVMWQIPLGNTKMRSQNNTTGQSAAHQRQCDRLRGRASALGAGAAGEGNHADAGHALRGGRRWGFLPVRVTP